MDAILIQANAKINLDFQILGKRPDGYHLIKSTVQSIDLADFLLFQKAKRDYFTGSIVCPESENIIFKAKKILEKTLNKKLPCRIHLQKVIPISAGLGGGSADAAATMAALNKLYNLNFPRKELVGLGVRAGADVPFFFSGGTGRIEGIGEKITPIKKKLPRFFVLFRPHKRVETRLMYKLYDKTGKNFLELNREVCPEIKKLEKYLAKFKLKAKLSGSGPTMFCQVGNYQLAKRLTENYQDFNGDIFICQPQDKALKMINL